MLPGKRDFYRCYKARRSASQVNKEFWKQFRNYAPPSLRVIRTNFARTIHNIYAILNWTDLRVSRSLRSLANDNIYIHDSRLNRPESLSLASLARQ